MDEKLILKTLENCNKTPETKPKAKKFKVGTTVSIIDHPKSDKTNFYKVVGHQDWNDDYGWETTIEKAGEKVTMFENLLEKSVAPKVVKAKSVKVNNEPKFKVGEFVLVNYGEEKGKKGKITKSYSDEIPYYEIEGVSKEIPESNLELFFHEPKNPKPSHKTLVAKLKAKKSKATPSNAPSIGHKRDEGMDKKRTALPLGRRVSEDGNVYYENRLNRADRNPKKKFEEGGEVYSHKHSKGWGENITIKLIEPTSKGWKVEQTTVKGKSKPKTITAFFSKEEIKDLFNKEDKFEEGGEIGNDKKGWGLDFLNW